MTNYFTNVCAVNLLNLGFDDWDKKADKCKEKESFFHEEKLFIGEGCFSGILNQVKKDFLWFLNFLWLFQFLFFEIGNLFISKINSLPVDVVVMNVLKNFNEGFVFSPANWFQLDADCFTHFFFFLFYNIEANFLFKRNSTLLNEIISIGQVSIKSMSHFSF